MLVDVQLKAIADPTRREILRLASSREMPAGEISRAFKMSRPSVSRHLSVLLKAGLIELRPEGTARYYKTNQRAISDIRHWFNEYWDIGLPRLKNLAEEEHKNRGT